ncbi:Hsp33 family molecular chaperone HslO [Myxococcota bacterium]
MDCFLRGMVPNDAIVVGIATTTDMCRNAQRVHELGATSAVALGRLMTAAVLTGLLQKLPGAVSLQVVCGGRLKQVFADITDQGAVRGYVKPPNLALPPLTDEQRLGRRTLSHVVGNGSLSVIRSTEGQPFTQSSTNLVAGEIDVDVEHFLETSDQIPSAIATDVLLDEQGHVRLAAGALAQAKPGASSKTLDKIRESLSLGAFTRLLETKRDRATDLMDALVPGANVDPPVDVGWQCRCSPERVQASLRMLEPEDFADLVSRNVGVTVTCDFCKTAYDVSPEEIERAYTTTIKGNG